MARLVSTKRATVVSTVKSWQKYRMWRAFEPSGSDQINCLSTLSLHIFLYIISSLAQQRTTVSVESSDHTQYLETAHSHEQNREVRTHDPHHQLTPH